MYEKTGMALGNQRPPFLQRVETEIFRSLFRLATQELDLVKEMKECMSRLPWSDLQNLEDLEISWFKAHKDQEQSTLTLAAQQDMQMRDLGELQPPTNSFTNTQTGGSEDDPMNGDSIQPQESLQNDERQNNNTQRSTSPSSEGGSADADMHVDEEHPNAPRDLQPPMGVDNENQNVAPEHEHVSYPNVAEHASPHNLRPRNSENLGKRKVPPFSFSGSPKKSKVKRASDLRLSKQLAALGDSADTAINIDELFHFVSIRNPKPFIHSTNPKPRNGDRLTLISRIHPL